ncbi:MFS transporter [Streptomyces buecherae]|uniref:MFS transporter n=1 Tax=Streptomyces buecherae TaxID=2763006 RepID=UPI001E402AF1|nr:MFS transporter [Streptomyces buecherae]
MSSLYLQHVRGYDPLHAGLFMLPMATMALFSAPLSGRIVGTRGPRAPLLIAGTALSASATLQALTYSTHLSATVLFTAYTLFGVGFGMVNAPITNTAIASLPRSQAGVAAAMASTSRQLGQALGVAVIGALLATDTHLNPAATHPHPDPTAFIDGSRTAWWLIAGCGGAILLIGTLTSGHRAQPTAQRTAQQLATKETQTTVKA